MQNTGPQAGSEALVAQTSEWSTSQYCTRVLRECMTAWWTLRFQPYRISFEDQVLAASRGLSVSHFMDRPWLLRE